MIYIPSVYGAREAILRGTGRVNAASADAVTAGEKKLIAISVIDGTKSIAQKVSATPKMPHIRMVNSSFPVRENLFT